jgi:hypothetical protein
MNLNQRRRGGSRSGRRSRSLSIRSAILVA